MSSYNDETPLVITAIIVGIVIGLVLNALFNIFDTPGEAALACQKLRDKGVQITVNEYGNYWLWNEQAKTSTKISASEVQNMSNPLQRIK